MQLTAANTYTNTTTISAGTLQISGTGSLGSGSYGQAISDGGALAVSTSINQTLSGAITGGGVLTQSGPGMLTLSNASNAYGGGTNVLGGMLYFSGASLPSSGTVSVANATLSTADGTARTMNIGGLSLGSGAELAMDFGDKLSTAGTAAAAGNVVLSAGGSFTSGTAYTLLQAASGLNGASYIIANNSNYTAA